jgi:hypothetical protein
MRWIHLAVIALFVVVTLTKGEYAMLLASSMRPSGLSAANTCSRPRGCTRISSTGASMCRSCGCGGSSRADRMRPASSAPSAVSVMSSICQSSGSDKSD